MINLKLSVCPSNFSSLLSVDIVSFIEGKLEIFELSFIKIGRKGLGTTDLVDEQDMFWRIFDEFSFFPLLKEFSVVIGKFVCSFNISSLSLKYSVLTFFGPCLPRLR
jgi:hypothetical protein